MNSEFIDVEWYSTESTIGVVLIYDKHMGFKCYIGTPPMAGISEEADTEWIRGHGTKLGVDLAFAVWGKRMKAEWQSRHPNLDTYNVFRYDGTLYKMDLIKEVVE